MLSYEINATTCTVPSHVVDLTTMVNVLPPAAVSSSSSS